MKRTAQQAYSETFIAKHIDSCSDHASYALILVLTDGGNLEFLEPRETSGF